MTAILVHRSGSLKGRRDNFEADRIRLGRKRDNDIVFSEGVVSSHHAEIRCKANRYVLIDLESANGTFVNGKPVERVQLQDRDVVEMGEDGPRFEFRTKSADDPLPSIIPVSGSWDPGNTPIKLEPGTIRLGRGLTNHLVVGRTPGSVVSSEHCEIRLDGHRCELEDLDSSNGTYVNGTKVRIARLRDGDRVELGKGGPQFELRWADQNHYNRKKSSAREDRSMIEKLKRATRGGQVGERTMIYLRVAKDYYKRRRRPFVTALVAGSIVLAAVMFYAYHLRRQLEQKTQLANFYKIREYDLEGRTAGEDQREGIRAKRRQLEQKYDEYLNKVAWYAKKSDQEKAVMSLARRLGESDLIIPEDFYQKVQEYVAQWRSTSKLSRAMENGRKNNLIKRILQQLHKKDLPPEFLYIALQESDFDARRSGIVTRFGIAKGLWQFIPGTAKHYGLELGPEQDKPVHDPSDQRHDEDRSTLAAADYLSDLYSTQAAASGLLVMACYNYGPTRIEKRILERVPNNPQERNFWNFYRKEWIPHQTRDYVMKIFSAALICENPTRFGFPADICDPDARKTGAASVPYRSSDLVFPVTDSASSDWRERALLRH